MEQENQVEKLPELPGPYRQGFEVQNEAWTLVAKMSDQIKSLEYDLAEMTVENNQLQERVKKLASRQPAWPKGYRPQRRHNSTQSR